MHNINIWVTYYLLVNFVSNQLENPKQCITMDTSRQERAMVVRDSKGDWCLVVARWAVYHRGKQQLVAGKEDQGVVVVWWAVYYRGRQQLVAGKEDQGMMVARWAVDHGGRQQEVASISIHRTCIYIILKSTYKHQVFYVPRH